MSIRSFLPRRFRRDDRGQVLLHFAIIVPVLLAVIGIALEGGSFMHLNSDLQELADASALAGAKELDGAADALTRATDAATNLLNNDPKWSNIAQSGVQITAPVFFSQITPSQVTTTDPKQARFIRVTTINRGVSTSFPRAVNANNDNFTAATATAQVSYQTCKPLQSFMCNPWEGEQTYRGGAKNFLSKVPIGTMIHLLDWKTAPGNWGLIDPPGVNQNPHNQSPFWAQQSAGGCITGSTGSPRPGNVSKFAVDGMNVRFNSPVGSGDESVSAPIVINGYKVKGNNYSCKQYGSTDDSWTQTTGQNQGAAPNGTGSQTGINFKQANQDANAASYRSYCNANPVIGSCPLPRDRNLSSTNIIGNGPHIDDLRAYWTNHHPGTLPDGVTTRWQIYQLEVAGAGDAGVWKSTGEPHAPTCSNATAGTAERRLINVGIVDCNYWSINGNSDPLPAKLLVGKFFMTESALNDGSIYAELVDIHEANDEGGAQFQLIQLVR